MSDHGAIPDSGPPLLQVLVDTEDGQAGIVYGPGPGFEVVGVLFVPAELLAEDG
jgi:hypothetical protein